MIKSDESLIAYQEEIKKNPNSKPRPEQRRFTEESVNFHRSDVIGAELFDKMTAVLQELGMNEYIAACLVVALYLEAEKQGSGVKKLQWIYTSYLKEAAGSLSGTVEKMISMI